MIRFHCHVKGMAPLLFNRFPDEDNPEGKSKKKKAVESKDVQVEKSLYRTKDGKIYQPAEHFVGAMIKAGVQFKLDGKKTYKDVVKGGVFVEPLQIIHESQEYDKDWRVTVIPSTRGRVMKGRARMDNWQLKFDVVCIDDRATPKDIKEILEYAGAYIGVGDYRPRYGRFEVVSMEEVK